MAYRYLLGEEYISRVEIRLKCAASSLFIHCKKQNVWIHNDDTSYTMLFVCSEKSLCAMKAYKFTINAFEHKIYFDKRSNWNVSLCVVWFSVYLWHPEAYFPLLVRYEKAEYLSEIGNEMNNKMHSANIK